MKLLRTHYDLIFFIFLPLLVLIILSLAIGKPFLVESFKLHWISWLLIIILLFQKISQQRIGTHIRFKFIYALLLTFFVQLSIFLCFLLISETAILSVPMIAILPRSAFYNTLQNSIITYGNFPWGLIILLSIIMAYWGYIRQQTGRANILFRPLLRNQSGDSISIFIDAAGRICFGYVYSLTLVFLIIQMAYIAVINWHIPLMHGLAVGVVMMVSLLYFIELRHLPRKFITFLYSMDWPIWLIFLSFMFAICCMLFVATILLIICVELAPTLVNVLPVSRFPQANLSWQLFINLWWLAWCPIIAGLLIKIWQGHRISSLILGAFIFPVLITALTICDNGWLSHFFETLQPKARGIFFTITLGLFLIIFCRESVLRYIARSTLPSASIERKRDPRASLLAIAQTTFSFVLVYLVSGFYPLSFLAFIILFIFIFLLLYCILAFYLGKKKAVI